MILNAIFILVLLGRPGSLLLPSLMSWLQFPLEDLLPNRGILADCGILIHIHVPD